MTERTHPPIKASVARLILLATGVTWSLISLQWVLVTVLGTGASQEGEARTLLAIAAVSLGLGLATGIFAKLLGRWLPGPATAVALPPSLLLFFEVYVRLISGADGVGSHSMAAITGAGACSLVGFFLAYRLLSHLPTRVRKAETWWAIAASLFIVALALTAAEGVDSVGIILALGVAAGAALMVWFWWHWRPTNLLPYLALTAVVTASAWLATRVPTYPADVAAATKRSSILLITVDTLRADHVGAYGYENARTLHLDSLAAEGILFRETIAPSPLTGPSHTSILTGLLPATHGILWNKARVGESIITLADMLRREGFITGAFVSGYTTLDSACGLPSRFHAFDDDIRGFRWLPQAAYQVSTLRLVQQGAKVLGLHKGPFRQPYRMGAETVDRAIGWLDHNGDRPYFVWVHLYDPHLPYRPPPQYRQGFGQGSHSRVSGNWFPLNPQQRTEIVNSPEKLAAMIALYDAEIAYADAQIGRLIAAARRNAPDGELLIVATSDHGEPMGEHGRFWFRDLYDPTLRVPLIIVPPTASAIKHREISAQVRLIDVTPTILELLDVPAPPVEFDGASLVGLMAGTTADSPGPAISAHTPALQHESFRERRAVRESGWKLIRRSPGWDGHSWRDGTSQELYNLHADPGENNDLIEEQPPLLGVLETRLDDHKQINSVPELRLSPEDRERLRSLGYIR